MWPRSTSSSHTPTSLFSSIYRFALNRPIALLLLIFLLTFVAVNALFVRALLSVQQQQHVPPVTSTTASQVNQPTVAVETPKDHLSRPFLHSLPQHDDVFHSSNVAAKPQSSADDNPYLRQMKQKSRQASRQTLIQASNQAVSQPTQKPKPPSLSSTELPPFPDASTLLNNPMQLDVAERIQSLIMNERIAAAIHQDPTVDLDCSAQAVTENRIKITANDAKPGVDAVFTFIRHDDIGWQATFNMFKNPENMNDGPNGENRFRDWSELKFAMRSAKMYAKFIRNTYLVVSSRSQLPDWLKVSAWTIESARHRDSNSNEDELDPLVRVVLHDDIFNDPDKQLPTFNSLAIESMLHRIPGLSHHFLYFNNDVFLNRPSPLSTFITKHSYKQYLDWTLFPYQFDHEHCVRAPVPNGNATQSLDSDQVIDAFNHANEKIFAHWRCFDRLPFYLDRLLIYQLFGIERSEWSVHAPHLWQRCAMYEIEHGPIKPWVDRARLNRFRSKHSDISMHLQQEALLEIKNRIAVARRLIPIDPEISTAAMQKKIRHRFYSVDHVLKADQRDESRYSIAAATPHSKPPSLVAIPVRQVRMVWMNAREGHFYLYKTFCDKDVSNERQREFWLLNLKRELQFHHQFVCLDDDLKTAPLSIQDELRQKMLQIFQEVWPVAANWEM